MKSLPLAFALLLSLVVRAQVLPIPSGKNPDWVLLKTEKRAYDGQVNFPPGTDRMPNAAGKSISSRGNYHYYWDADRQLTYDWVSRGTSMAPFKLVNVREQRKDIVYIYRRAN